MVGIIVSCFSTLRGHAFASYSTQSFQRSGGGHEARSRTVICSPLGAMCCCKGISVIRLFSNWICITCITCNSCIADFSVLWVPGCRDSTQRNHLPGNHETMLVGEETRQREYSGQTQQRRLCGRCE